MRPSWDSIFLEIAFTIAKRSPDAQTKCGCVIVNSNNQVVSLGFNGFARNCKDKNIPNTRPDKYFYILHSEHNAILNSSGRNLEKTTVYITGEPCSKCLMMMYHVGVSRIVYPKNSPCKPKMIDKNDKKIKRFFLSQCKRKMQIQAIKYVTSSV